MLTLVGRSSSHFTRVTRVMAAELGVAHEFQVVKDLRSLEASDYADNPALRLPILKSPRGTWFGALCICRELARHAPEGRRVVWPEELTQALTSNVQELTLQAMASEVTLIMAELAGTPATDAQVIKLGLGLRNMLGFLDQNVDAALARLPRERDTSFLEVTLFCLLRHLEFRKLLDTSGWHALGAFAERFELRASAQATPYRFDVFSAGV
jgi:glutathione S-transferase